MVTLFFNGQSQHIDSAEALARALEGFDRHPVFELVCSATHGQALFMLRNGSEAWLMYLRHDGDSGFHSLGHDDAQGTASFRLSNGQFDDCPRAWCIDLAQCYQAVAYFVAHDGGQPGWLRWAQD